MRIVAFAYACEPNRGSEPGAGWNLARALAGFGDTWVITRANNAPVIERAIQSIPERDRLHFVYVDLPSWARFWKRGRHGIHLYYLLWQFAALRTARRLHAAEPFDLVWHLTMANIWFGSAAALLPIPFVYGPVGGGAKVSWKFLRVLGVRGVAYELARSVASTWGRYLNPLARIAWRRAILILVQNEETRRWLPRGHRAKAEEFVNIIFDSIPQPPPRARPRDRRVALFAGNLFPFKGVTLALHTIRLLTDWKFLVVGNGPDERRLRRLARRLGIEDRVEFRPWQERSRLLAIMRDEVDLLLFPSLHDQGPWVVAEALSCGLRVVAVQGGAASSIGAEVVEPAGVHETAQALASRVEHGRSVRPGRVAFDLRSRREQLHALLRRREILPMSAADESERNQEAPVLQADIGRDGRVR